MKKILYLAFAGMISSVALISCGDDDDDVKNVPDRYIQALETKYPGVTAKWETKRGGYYVAEFYNQNNCEVDAWFDGDAKWVMSETDFGKNRTLLPDAVNTAYEASAYWTDNWAVDDIDFFERPDIDFYVIEIEKNGQRDRDLYYRPDGSLIKDVVSSDTDIRPDTPILE